MGGGIAQTHPQSLGPCQALLLVVGLGHLRKGGGSPFLTLGMKQAGTLSRATHGMGSLSGS